MSLLRVQTLEDWDILVNPYRLLRDAITQLKSDLDDLALNPEEEKLENPFDFTSNNFKDKWTEIMSKYNRGIGLAMALRTMTPILAESFVNFILFMLCRSDIKQNERLYTSAVRSNIDVRVQSLHINCVGFNKAVDWKSPECSRYNSIVNERNDMLHGNIAVDKLKFSEIYFLGKVPVFKKYEGVWQQSIGVSINASGLDKVISDLEAVDEFIEYVLSCLNQDIRRQIEIIINRRDIGINKKNNRLGALLPEHITDFSIE